MEENKKGAFISKVEDYAKEMSEMARERRDGVKRGLIVLAAEEVKDEDGTKSVVSYSGSAKKLAELVAVLAMHDEAERFFAQGLKLASLKIVFEEIEGEASND